MKKVKDIFKAPEFGWVGDNFKNQFYEMDFKPSNKKLYIKILERRMTDKEILNEFKPTEITLGELYNFLKSSKTLENNCANIAFIRDDAGTLWAVGAGWGAGGGGWDVDAISVGYPDEWGSGYQVLSQAAFGDLTSGNLEILPEELTINNVKYRKVL